MATATGILAREENSGEDSKEPPSKMPSNGRIGHPSKITEISEDHKT